MPTYGRIVQNVQSYMDIEQVRATSGKPISAEMMLILALVIFDGYTIGGRGERTHSPDCGKAGHGEPA